jgi:DNA gyrase subunit B
MRDLIEQGHLYIAQPPLYRVSRKGKHQYVQDDRELQKVLLALGASEATLEYGLDGSTESGKLDADRFGALLGLLSAFELLMHRIEQQGTPFAEYLALRNGSSGEQFPLYRVIHTDREGGGRVLFFYSEEEYDRFVLLLQEELRTHGEEPEIIEEDDYEGLARAREARNVIRPHRFHEAPELARLVAEIERCGIPGTCLLPAGEGRPEAPEFLISSNGEVCKVASLSEVIPAVRDLGRRGLDVARYKGLGEMNAGELAETTLQPQSRKLVQVNIGDAIVADKYFSILAGKDVKRRREFIEMHALEVSNLDV